LSNAIGGPITEDQRTKRSAKNRTEERLPVSTLADGEAANRPDNWQDYQNGYFHNCPSWGRHSVLASVIDRETTLLKLRSACLLPSFLEPSKWMVTLENEMLQPHLELAQKALVTALDEACGVDLGQASTDELIRIEETLSSATQAAKQVVTFRLRRRKERAAGRSETPHLPAATSLADVIPTITQRVFDDIRGKRWRVIAVRPATPTEERIALPEQYREGWLSFEAAGEEKRRVAPIPAGWEELPIEELRLLCQRAQRAPKRTSRPVPPPESTSQ
jgi:hypothetical protein